MMGIACVLIVLLFQTLDKLTTTYGIAVAVCMTITDISMSFVKCWVWKFHWMVAIIVALPFVFVDGFFLSLNCLKLANGLHSWVSIIIAVVAWFSLYSHWWSKTIVKEVAHFKLQGGGGERGVYDGDDVAPVQTDLTSMASMTTAMDIDNFLCLLKESKMLKHMPVAGVFLMPYPKTFPLCLSTLARSMAALPKTIILLQLLFSPDKPFVDKCERYNLHCHSKELGVYCLNMYFGYCEPITEDHFDVNNSMREIFQAKGYVALQKLAEVQRELTLLMPFYESWEELYLNLRDSHWTYFLGIQKNIPHAKENIFAKLLVYICNFLTRNSKSSRDFFDLRSIDTIKVDCTTTIQSKDHPSETKETLGESELSDVELAKKGAGENYKKNELSHYEG
jgi:K+ transporter